MNFDFWYFTQSIFFCALAAVLIVDDIDRNGLCPPKKNEKGVYPLLKKYDRWMSLTPSINKRNHMNSPLFANMNNPCPV